MVLAKEGSSKILKNINIGGQFKSFNKVCNPKLNHLQQKQNTIHFVQKILQKQDIIHFVQKITQKHVYTWSIL